METRQATYFKVALIFILINATIWLLFGIGWGTGLLQFGSISFTMRLVSATLGIIAGGVLLVLGFLLRKQNRPAYYLTLMALAGLILVTFMDQVGLADWIYLIVVITPLILLLSSRQWYFNKQA